MDFAQYSLFAGISTEERERLLDCMEARRALYQKDDILIREGAAVREVGIALRGQGASLKMDEDGKTTLISLLPPGGFVGLLLAAGRERPSPVTVRALNEMDVLWLPFGRIFNTCSRACTAHETLLRNCFDSVAEKSLQLLDRIDCLIRPNLREKILTYLRQIALQNGSRSLHVPLDRSVMAAYLNTERSALSRELSHMRRDGLIDYYQNSFKLL